ncbi:MAG: SDR family NAD(P)-dependent oxidoreductase [Muribaculaceae bacterium]|nr:SDR family NAD(P)-dependent oxidoreductase [Muribaculaceae bacterium]
MNENRKRAVIVGASSGIGREVARLLLADGWHCGLGARRQEKLAELQAEWPEQVKIAAIDVTAGDAEDALLRLVEELGGMDLYFHAAGIGWQNRTLAADKELATVETNAVGFARMVGAAYRYMAANGGGQIAVISSIAGTKGLGPAPAYSATKAMQNCYIQALEQQARSRRLNISFTDIRPGFVDTALLAGDPYPMLLKPENVAREIVRAIRRKRHVAVIDWRWRILTAAWRRVPRCVWRRLKL